MRRSIMSRSGRDARIASREPGRSPSIVVVSYRSSSRMSRTSSRNSGLSLTTVTRAMSFPSDGREMCAAGRIAPHPSPRRRCGLHLAHDLAAVEVELLFLGAIHQVDVELRHAGLAELLQPLALCRWRPDDRELIGDLIAYELGVVAADLGMVEVVVPLATLDVAPELLRQLFLRVLVDEVDDVVADQCREPAHLVAGQRDVVRDIGRRGRHDLDRVGI